MRASLPLPLRTLAEEIEEQLAHVPSELNEYGYDPFRCTRAGSGPSP